MSFLMFLWRVRFGYPRVGVAIINGRMEGCFSIVNIYLNNCVCPVPFRSFMLSLTQKTCVHHMEKQPGGCFESRYSIFINFRSNYAWDLGALNSNMMSYSHFGTRNTDFEVFQKTVILPMDGKVVTVVREVHFLINCGNVKVAIQLH